MFALIFHVGTTSVHPAPAALTAHSTTVSTLMPPAVSQPCAAVKWSRATQVPGNVDAGDAGVDEVVSEDEWSATPRRCPFNRGARQVARLWATYRCSRSPLGGLDDAGASSLRSRAAS